MMLRSLIIPPLRGRISVSALPSSAPLRLFPISSMRVPLDVRRTFSVGNNLPIESHVGGRGPFAAANSLRKPLSLQRPVQLASIVRLFSLNPRLLRLFDHFCVHRHCSSNSNDPPESLGEYIQVEGTGENVTSQGCLQTFLDVSHRIYQACDLLFMLFSQFFEHFSHILLRFIFLCKPSFFLSAINSDNT